MKCIRLHSRYFDTRFHTHRHIECVGAHTHTLNLRQCQKQNLAAKTAFTILVTFRVIILTHCFESGNCTNQKFRLTNWPFNKPFPVVRPFRHLYSSPLLWLSVQCDSVNQQRREEEKKAHHFVALIRATKNMRTVQLYDDTGFFWFG